jgi:hypothetical protein
MSAGGGWAVGWRRKGGEMAVKWRFLAVDGRRFGGRWRRQGDV